MTGCQLLPRIGDQFRILRNRSATGPLRHDQTTPLQFRKCLLHRVRIHRCHRRQITDAGELLSRLIFSGYDFPLDPFYQLRIDWSVSI